MKKLILLLSALICVNCFALNNNMTLNTQPGQEINSFVNGKLVQIGNNNLPSDFGKNTIVIAFRNKYYYNNQTFDVEYQVIISNLTLSSEIKKMKVGDTVTRVNVLGSASAKAPIVNVRCQNLDYFLVDVASALPEMENGWIYYGVDMFRNNVPKFLQFKEFTSKNDMIEFADYPESLGGMRDRVLEEDKNSPNKVSFNAFPSFTMKIKTKLDKYPEQIKKNNTTDILLISQNFPNCSDEIYFYIDGIPFRAFVQNGFKQYFLNEYKLGNDIYLYLNVLYLQNGVYNCYLRDFSLEDNEISLEKKIADIKKALNIQ